jgi:hypothetical protein
MKRNISTVIAVLSVALFLYGVGAVLIVHQIGDKLMRPVCSCGYRGGGVHLDGPSLAILAIGAFWPSICAILSMCDSIRWRIRRHRNQCMQCGNPLPPRGGPCSACKAARRRPAEPMPAFPVILKRRPTQSVELC